MLTALKLLHIINTAEWFRYTGAVDQGYATAGTHGTPDAIDLRCPVPGWTNDQTPQFIEYRHVGKEEWHHTGYAAVMRYDTSRKHAEDGDGYEFIPYHVTRLERT